MEQRTTRGRIILNLNGNRMVYGRVRNLDDGNVELNNCSIQENFQDTSESNGVVNDITLNNLTLGNAIATRKEEGENVQNFENVQMVDDGDVSLFSETNDDSLTDPLFDGKQASLRDSSTEKADDENNSKLDMDNILDMEEIGRNENENVGDNGDVSLITTNSGTKDNSLFAGEQANLCIDEKLVSSDGDASIQATHAIDSSKKGKAPLVEGETDDLNDSIIFVEEYIDLDCPEALNNRTISSQPGQEADAKPVILAMPVAIPVKLEKSVENVIQPQNVNENNISSMVKAERGMELVRSSIYMPAPIDVKGEASCSDDQSTYFGDGSCTSTDFESLPDRTNELIQLYHGKENDAARKLEFDEEIVSSCTK